MFCHVDVLKMQVMMRVYCFSIFTIWFFYFNVLFIIFVDLSTCTSMFPILMHVACQKDEEE